MNCHTASEKLILGRQTEHGVETIKFPIADWISNYGSGGTFHLWHKRSTDTNAYPVVITSDEQFVYWTPTATDLAYNGFGEAQLGYSFGTVGQTGYRKAMSQIWTTRVDRSVEAGSSAPTPYVPWVTQVEGFADRAEDAAEEAEASAEEAAAIAASIHGIPSGGTTGQVMKKNSNTDYDISWQDESGGGSSDFDELTNRPSYNGTAMTHTTNIPEVKTDTWDGKYSKPASGVPKTDLASDVQESLNKADSALQSVPPTYRTAALQDIIDNELDSRLDAAELDIDNLESGKVDKVSGKGLSTNDYDNTEKQKVADAYNVRHSHDNKSVLDGITSQLVIAWNNAATWITTNGSNVLNHIADTVAHITGAERTKWNGYESTITTQSTDIANLQSGKADIEKWELIETITLDSPTPQIPRNKEPDNTPYDFKAVMICTKFVGSPSVNRGAWLDIMSGSHQINGAGAYIENVNATNTSTITKIYQDNGLWNSLTSSGGNASYGVSVKLGFPAGFVVPADSCETYPNITSINLIGEGGTLENPLQIYIYAIRR